MPFTWQININKNANGTGYNYSPESLTNVAIGDVIIWTNNDSIPHWPALKNGSAPLNKTYFMANQIAPNSPSANFVPGVTGTFTYVDSLDYDPDSAPPTGTIVVS